DILFRYPTGDISGDPSTAPIVSVAGTVQPLQTVETIGFSGQPRFAAIEEIAKGVFVASTVPVDIVLKRTLKTMEIAGVLLLITAMIVAVLTWLISDRLIVRAVRGLSVGARRLLAGDLSARVILKGDGELPALAATFNNMAAALESRKVENDRIVEELQAS